MEPESATLTYEDLRRFPEDGLRRELLGGELVVTPSPAYAHQWAVTKLAHHLFPHATRDGGRLLTAPFDVRLSEVDVVQPDLVYTGPARAATIRDEGVLTEPPDLVIEVSSPSTRQLELVRKRELYERFGVREYWLVDLDGQRIEVYRLERDRYGLPELFGMDGVVTSELLPGLALSVADVIIEERT